MPDSKITALASTGTGTDPANDPLVIVDVSDTSMAASGTTKKVTLNNLLACSPTATLASATITGDLTVASSILKVTGGNVGINTATPTNTAGYKTLEIVGTGVNTGGMIRMKSSDSSVSSYDFIDNNGRGIFAVSNHNLRFGCNDIEQYRIQPLGIFTWYDGAGGTRMTLNSAGLGVGATPSYQLHVAKSQSSQTAVYIDNQQNNAAASSALLLSAYGGQWSLSVPQSATFVNPLIFKFGSTEMMRIDSSGNVGISVTPSAWAAGAKALEIGSLGSGISSGSTFGGTLYSSCNAYNDGSWKYARNAAASLYGMNSDKSFAWYQNSNSPSVGGAITFTQAMTLDASGNLLVGTTTNTNSSRVFARGTASSSALALQGATGDVALAQLTVGKFDNNTTTSQVFVRFTINDNSGGSGQINANGASQAAFGSFSDSRLKENIVSLPSQLASILSLRPVEFDYKDGSGHQIGFVAQEMQEVYSDAVGEQNGFLTVTGWSKTEARLVSAIKELAAKVQALEAKLA
jgi:hypothetical protein